MRTVRLTRRNVEILGNIVELHAHPDDYLFKNTLGEPIEQRSFYRLFRDAIRVLEIRPRDLYATKDTYVSVAITAGVNLTWLSEQTGVAETTLRKHYGRFVHTSVADVLLEGESWRHRPRKPEGGSAQDPRCSEPP